VPTGAVTVGAAVASGRRASIAENTLAATSERRAGDGRRVRREETSLRRREYKAPAAVSTMLCPQGPRLVTAIQGGDGDDAKNGVGRS